MSVFKKKKKRESLGEVSTASTSDISFLLLIFFIVSTIFAEEMGLVMILPGKQKTSSDVVKVKESNVATLAINFDNTLTLDKRSVELGQIKSLIEARIMANEKTIVVLKTHPDAHYGTMVACLDELKLANAKKLTLKTSRR